MAHLTRLWPSAALLALTPLVRAQQAPVLEAARILPWTLELEQHLQPWCPQRCIDEAPFTASYRQSGHGLVFVAVRHVFTPRNPTLQAVAAGFAEGAPTIVILEGFPTAMGENPAPLVAQAATRGTAEADGYTRGEGMYAASLALKRNIPFIGGEPTRSEERDGLLARGFDPQEIAFAFSVRGLASAVHAGDIDGAHDARLGAAYEQVSADTAHQYSLPQLPFPQFSDRYRSVFGVDISRDANLSTRGEPGVESAVARVLQASMAVRDRHLLATIQQQLQQHRQVLVVYGGSHWTTLSAALRAGLGEPAIRASFAGAPQPD